MMGLSGRENHNFRLSKKTQRQLYVLTQKNANTRWFASFFTAGNVDCKLYPQLVSSKWSLLFTDSFISSSGALILVYQYCPFPDLKSFVCEDILFDSGETAIG
jgi:hypothetical protein